MPNFEDYFISLGIFSEIKKQLERIFNVYVLAGYTIFSPTKIDENLIFKARLNKVDYEIMIKGDTKTFFSGEMLSKASTKDNIVITNVVNNILKQAFRETSLTQIGKDTKFFDLANTMEFDGSDMTISPGFRGTATNYFDGHALVIENVSKLMCKQKCIDRINEIYYSTKN